MPRYLRSTLLLMGSAALIGCQSILHTERSSNSTLACSGATFCQFERVGELKADALERPQFKLSKDALVARFKTRLLAQDAADQTVWQAIQFPSGSQEVQVSFYPVSRDRAEVVNIIHAFEPGVTYRLNMYRKRTEVAGNLLNASTPDPLCVDLYQDKTVIRRFCRRFDSSQSNGEYREQKLS